MKVYTICSYSNLNQTIVLFDSIQKNTTRSFTFTCFMIDEVPAEFQFDSASFELVRVDELSKSISEFSALKSRYHPFELCCALKAFCGEILMSRSSEEEVVVYLDSDILFYNDIKHVEDEMADFDILLTPHFTNSPPDFEKISELDVNNSGLYNGGFVVFRNNKNGYDFLKWWKERMKQFCYTDFKNGMFVDQIWLNFVPLYFKNVLISRNKGLNVAYWNFHERKFANQKGVWKVNNETPLIFIHFSGFRLYRKDLISIHQTRYNFRELPEIKVLFEGYALMLEKNATLFHFEIPARKVRQRIQSKLKSILRNPFSKR